MAIDASAFDADFEAEAEGLESRRIAHFPSQDRKSLLPMLRWGDMANADPPRWLVKGVLVESTLSVLWGEPGSGKSFFALDMAAHIALSWPWREHRIACGAVVYLGLEGGRGLQSRVLALQRHYNAEDDGVVQTPFYLVPAPLDLLTADGDLHRTIGAIQSCGDVKLVVVDTLARAISGGNENSPEDMGAFIRNMDRIRDETGAHVMVVHHGGKDQTRGARGHSSLKAAADTEIEVRKSDVGQRIAKVTKQKDGVEGQEFAFELQTVDLGTDEDGDPITSCVCIPVDGGGLQTTKRRRVTGAAQILLSALNEAIVDAGVLPKACKYIPANVYAANIEVVRQYAYKRHISDTDTPEARKKAFQRALQRLQTENLVGIWEGLIWPA